MNLMINDMPIMCTAMFAASILLFIVAMTMPRTKRQATSTDTVPSTESIPPLIDDELITQCILYAPVLFEPGESSSHELAVVEPTKDDPQDLVFVAVAQHAIPIMTRTWLKQAELRRKRNDAHCFWFPHKHINMHHENEMVNNIRSNK